MTDIRDYGQGDLETVRRLFRAYADSLPFNLDFQGFGSELAGLPAPYMPPAGVLLLATQGGAAAVGVVGLKPLAPSRSVLSPAGGQGRLRGIAEIKRLYVVPEARGGGIGRALALRAIAEARARGYARVRLDTHRPSMSAGIALYRALGFVEIAPYGPNPGGAFAFFEKKLRE